MRASSHLQLLNGEVVEDLAALDDAVVAHGGVRVQRHVRAHHGLGELGLDQLTSASRRSQFCDGKYKVL